MENYVPDMYQNNIFTVNYQKLKTQGIKCLLFDLDNTLVPYRLKTSDSKTKELFDKLKDMGFKVIIFSNSPRIRVKPFKEELEVEIISSAKKPSKCSFENIMSTYKYNETEIAIIGDQLLTDILGGNRVGITTILVNPIDSFDPIWTRINRILENKKMKKLRDHNLFVKGRFYE
ncbi:MAG: YqeG family HAD IIIA-type phosphatase [Bacilli bacterium]